LIANMGTARKLFRLFKSLMEYKKIMALLKNSTMEATEKYLNVICRLAFFFYWVFDNIQVLTKVKFFSFMELKTATRYAQKFWLSGIFLSIVIAVMNMQKTAKQELGLEQAYKQQQIEEKEYLQKKGML